MIQSYFFNAYLNPPCITSWYRVRKCKKLCKVFLTWWPLPPFLFVLGPLLFCRTCAGFLNITVQSNIHLSCIQWSALNNKTGLTHSFSAVQVCRDEGCGCYSVMHAHGIAMQRQNAAFRVLPFIHNFLIIVNSVGTLPNVWKTHLKN